MLKKILLSSLILLATLTMTACGGSSCSTQDDVKEKAEELAKKFEDIVKSGDMAKIMSLGGKVQNIQNLGNSSDPQAACDIIDELMDEL